MLGYHEFLDGLDPRRRRPPRRDAADLQGVRRGAVPARPVPRSCSPPRRWRSGINMPARIGGDREAVEVERRDPRRHHAGGVHPAHRPRRPPRHRRRGPRRRALAAGLRPQGGRRSRLDAHLPAQVVVPAVVQHGGQPGAPVRPRALRASCWSRRSRSSRPTRRWSGWPGSCARPRRRSRGTPRRRPATSATSWSTPPCGAGSPTPRRASREARRVRPPRGGRSTSLESLRPGDVIEVPGRQVRRHGRRDRPAAIRRRPGRAAALRPDRRPAGPPAGAWSTSRRRSQAFTRMRIPKNFNGRNPQPRRDLASALRDRTHNLTPPPAERAQRSQDAARHSPVEDRRDRRAARTSCARTRATAAPTARTTPAGPSATSSWTGTPRPSGAGSSSAPTRSRGSSTGSATCYRAGLPRAATQVTDRGPHLMRIYTEMDLVAAESLRAGLWDGLDAVRAGGGAVRAGLRGAAAPTTPSAPRLPGGQVKQVLADMVSHLGRPRRAGARAPARLPARARPRLRLGGLPLGRGGRARRRPRRRPTSPPATSSAGSSSCSTWPTRSPTPRRRLRRCARSPARPSAPAHAAAWWPTRRVSGVSHSRATIAQAADTGLVRPHCSAMRLEHLRVSAGRRAASGRASRGRCRGPPPPPSAPRRGSRRRP